MSKNGAVTILGEVMESSQRPKELISYRGDKGLILAMSIDAGGSEGRALSARVGSIEPKDIYTVESNFVQVDKDTFRVRECDNPTDLIDIIKSKDNKFNGIIAAGSAALVYSGTNLSMNSIDNKTDSDSYYKEIIFCIAQEVRKQAKGEQNTIMVPLAIDIPIREYHSTVDAASKLKNTLAGSYTVVFPLLNGVQVNFEIKENFIGVLPEGGVVITTIEKPGVEELSIVDDLGRISRDISLYKGKKMISKVKLDGTAAGDLFLTLTSSILMDHKHSVTRDEVIRAIETGVIPKGKDTVDVSSLINLAKQEFVNNHLKQDLINTIVTSGFKPDSVRRYCPVGQLMNKNDRTGYLPEMITKAVGMDNTEIVETYSDLRYANIVALNKYAVKLKDAYINS